MGRIWQGPGQSALPSRFQAFWYDSRRKALLGCIQHPMGNPFQHLEVPCREKSAYSLWQLESCARRFACYVPSSFPKEHFRQAPRAGSQNGVHHSPWNPVHLAEVKDGFVFHCGYATIELIGDAKLGDKTIPAGKYALRARAQDVNTWTFFVAPPPPIATHRST